MGTLQCSVRVCRHPNTVANMVMHRSVAECARDGHKGLGFRVQGYYYTLERCAPQIKVSEGLIGALWSTDHSI
eukprot:1155966-Pelagomonas_calceolata.AAC.7